MTPKELRDQTAAMVRSAMNGAMRADPAALARIADAQADALDPFTLVHLKGSRTLMLAVSAALTTVLTVHRYGTGPYGREICLACRTDRCRTIRGVAEVLIAYDLKTEPVDRPEAWRRADAWFARVAGRPVQIGIESFDAGYIARPATAPTGDCAAALIVDRRTGLLTRWPPLESAELIAHYHRYLRGDL